MAKTNIQSMEQQMPQEQGAEQNMMVRSTTTQFARRGLQKQLTGSQLVMIMSLRDELHMPRLSSHNITCLSIDAASRMIEDLIIFRDTLQAHGILQTKNQPSAQ